MKDENVIRILDHIRRLGYSPFEGLKLAKDVVKEIKFYVEYCNIKYRISLYQSKSSEEFDLDFIYQFFSKKVAKMLTKEGYTVTYYAEVKQYKISWENHPGEESLSSLTKKEAIEEHWKKMLNEIESSSLKKHENKGEE